MLYLTKEKVDSKHTDGNIIHSDSIYTTKEEKLKFIVLSTTEGMFLDLFFQIYPEAKKYYNQNSYSSYINIFNHKCIGISIQYAIAIVENPHIICTGYDVKFSYTTLFHNICTITKIIKTEYNGNYVKLTVIRNGSYYFLRILISKTDSEFIPSAPEFVYNSRSWYSKHAIWTKEHHYYDETIFIEDYDIEEFVNSDTVGIKNIWIFVNSNDHFKKIEFLSKQYERIYLIVRIKKFEYYNILSKELNKYKFIVFSNSNDPYPVKEHLLVSIACTNNNVFFDSELNIINRQLQYRVINYRDYGLILEKQSYSISITEQFEKMRRDKNLSTNTSLYESVENEYFNIY